MAYTSLPRSAALIVASALAFSVNAQDGAYDPAFGNVGRDWIDVTSSTLDEGTKLIRLPNGNLFMAGLCQAFTCAAWLTPSGSLAAGYGTSGSGTAWFSAFTGWLPSGQDPGPNDVAAFSDGRVVLTASYNVGHVAVLRADGTGLDAAVGNGAGYIAPPFPAQRVRVTPQQKVIVVGSNQATPVAIVVARYDSTLHLDTSFGNGGSMTIGFADEDTFPVGMTLQKDGKIVVLASVASALGILRLTAGGSPDPDFGINSDGRFKSTFGNSYPLVPSDIVVDKHGRLVFVGGVFINAGNSGEWFVNRLLSGGATDATFNGGAPQQFTIFGTSSAYLPQAVSVAVQNDGKILAAGTMDRPDNNVYKYFALARFTDTGVFDSSYGIGGMSYGDMSPQPDSESDYPGAMMIVPGGIVVGGSTTVAGNEARFSATKVLIDPLFASDFE